MIERLCALLIGYLIGNIRGRIFCKGFVANIIDVVKAFIPAAVTFYMLFYKYYIVSLALYFSFSYLELGIILGHNYPFFLRSIRDNSIAVYLGVVLFFNRFNPMLTFFCLVAYLGELYVTGNRKRAAVKLILVYTIGFVVSSYFGYYYGYMAWPLIEFNIITMIIGYVTYVRYNSGIRVKDKE
ncbi:MAG TPA: hypothetical protein DCX21_03620 [Eubacterium sp.]|nr:hypothetical protein [Eubacterium sp.]